MILTKLQLQNFRNYEKAELIFNDDLRKIVLLAKNAAGKTNILEAIYMLALTKSFHSKKYKDLILRGKDFGRVRGETEEISLEVFIDEMNGHNKVMKINDVKVTSTRFIGELNVVFFHPEDLNILYLSPSLRRQYLDILLCQTDRKYLQALSQYKKTVKQRNSLLFQISEGSKNRNNLEVWDEKLVETGTQVSAERAKTIKFFNKNVEDIYRKISGGNEKLRIEYKTDINPDFATQLAQNLDKDIRRRVTGIGPHHDNLVFFLNDNNIEEYGSRGEFRTVLLAMKIAEITYMEDRTGKKPILLLDDVFSELDPDRQKHLFEALGECQTLISTTDIIHLEDLNEKMHVFEIADGKLGRDYVK